MSLRLRFFCFFVFFFKQKTAYEMRISDWSSDVCSSDLLVVLFQEYGDRYGFDWLMVGAQGYQESKLDQSARSKAGAIGIMQLLPSTAVDPNVGIPDITTERNNIHAGRSEEHTSELQSLMSKSHTVFRFKNKNKYTK